MATLIAASLLTATAWGQPGDSADRKPDAPTWQFLGVPHDQSRKMEDENPRTALPGVVTMTRVQPADSATYQRFKKDGRIAKQKVRGEFIYFAVDETVHAPVGDQEGAYLVVTERYRVPVAAVNELTEVNVGISRHEGARHGPTKAELVRVWRYNREQSSAEWLKEHYGEKRVLHIQVPETPYSLLVIGGILEPLVAVSGPWELYRIDGLDDFCETVDVVEAGTGKVTLTAGGGDMRSILTLDFSNRLALEYREEYDGF